MAELITCPTCKKEVSNLAEKCPHCGHPIKEKESNGCLITIGGISIVVGFFWWPGFLIGILVFILASVTKE